MENTVARRATGIALMAIMVAGGMTIAFPGATPDVMAEPRKLANLGVSTTMFGGPMVVEIIVQDPNLDDTGIEQGEPDVTFDGKNLRMIQGDDGYWYAYVANARIVELFESTDTANNNRLGNKAGTGIDFGTYCPNPGEWILGRDNAFAETATVYTPSKTPCQWQNPADGSGISDIAVNNVVRSAPSPSTPGGSGSTGVDDNVGNNDLRNQNLWPFVQAFGDISDDSTIKVIYNKGGSPQEIEIRYEADMDDLASFDVDRSKYPHDAHVHLEISDNILNIDPTDDDIWTWAIARDTSNNFVTFAYYQLFDSGGQIANNVTVGNDPAARVQDGALRITAAERAAAEFGDSGTLTIDRNDAAVNVVASGNGAVSVNAVNDLGEHRLSGLLTAAETAQNSGVFESTDGDSESGLRTTGNADRREVDFTINYADTAKNWFVGYTTAVVSMDTA
ncbi:MAG: hypothetical protein MPL62_16165, partial [Alphaproteobacteria bacterium]|nr:hypothetical protein [Alphaproteobacteria bacterium]